MMVPMKLKLLFLILLSSSVFAQSMDAHHFNFSDTLETVGMEDAMGSSSERIKNQNPFLFRASFDYAHDSLSTAQASNNSLSVIDHMYSVTMGASTVLYSRVLLESQQAFTMFTFPMLTSRDSLIKQLGNLETCYSMPNFDFQMQIPKSILPFNLF